MKNKRISDVVLVYDRYYSKKPNPTALIVKRIGLCSVMALCAMMFVLSEYALPVNLLVCGVLSVVFTAAFSLLFVFVRKRFAIPGILILFGLVVWITYKSFWERFSYFIDAMCMVLDGRFVLGRALTNHGFSELTVDNELYINGVMFGTVLMIALFAMVTAAGMFPKPHTLPSFLLWIALWVPLFISEKFTFNPWIIPSLAVYMGAFAVSIAYKEGLSLKSGKNGTYRSSVSLNESTFKNSLARVPYMKRIGMMSTHYSKYFSLTLYAISIFTVTGILSSILLSGTEGFDYTNFYDFIVNIGQNSIINPPFDKSPIDEYFTSYKTSPNLGITSPGNSEMEVLKVTNAGNSLVYLRGDYGIGFYGNHWTSPVNNEPYEWKPLKESYRPAEVRVLQRLLQNEDPWDNTVESVPLSIEYLCDSKNVFLPAYTENFNYYENSMFDIYGDYVARVNDRYSKVNTLECTAMIPKYTNQNGDVDESTLQYLKISIDAVNKWDYSGIMDKVVPGSSVEQYKKYVESTFLAKSTDYRLTQALDKFWESSQLMTDISEINRNWELTELEARYLIADLICKYLRDNFTYSLSNENTGSNAINSFLNETKRGHCALYATSMTLLLRELGIPARYATGFVAPPTGNVPAILRSKNLHAWCEVYMDELGWVTFDPTSSAAFGDISYDPSSDSYSTSLSNSESSNSSSLSSDSRSSNSESRDSDNSNPNGSSGTEHDSVIDANDNDNTKVNVLPYILILLTIAAVVVLAVLIVHGYKALERRALKSLRRICRERKASIILEKVISLLEIGGLTPKPGELPEKFYLRAEKTLRCAFSVNKDMLEAVAFGTAVVPSTECEGLARLLEQLYNALDKKLELFDKIKLLRAFL